MSLSRCLVLSLLCAAGACEPTGKPGAPIPEQTEPMKVEVQAAGTGPVRQVVSDAQIAAAKDGRRLIVYVGASWCEPCQYFLSAIHDDELPETLGDLRFLKFDHDQDEQRLNEAGYGGELIPRFVLPGKEGKPTEYRFEGSIKGPEAIANILPRLEAILRKP